MKKTKFILSAFLLFATFVGFSQQYDYVRKPIVQSVCSLKPDSVSGKYLANNTRWTFYSYDSLARTVSMIYVEDFSDDTLENRQIFYKPDNLTETWDSLYSSSNISVTNAYNSDSLLINQLWYTEPSHTIRDSTAFTYTKVGDVWHGNSLQFYAQGQNPIDTIGSIQIWIKDQKAQREIIERKYYDISSRKIEYSYRHQTFNSDTIITVVIDSILDPIFNDVTFAFDSTYAIARETGNYKITKTFNKQEGSFSESKTQNLIDSSRLDGTLSIRYVFDAGNNRFSKRSKSEKVKNSTQEILTQYNWLGNTWSPTYKTTTYLYEGDCKGSVLTYEFKNGQWQPYNTVINYYAGKTNVSILDINREQKCSIVNPFNSDYPFDCYTLSGNEKYTLTVYNMQGILAARSEFMPGNRIAELHQLSPSTMYFFVITNSNGELVSKQKILMQP
jgi:hypothetical protein